MSVSDMVPNPTDSGLNPMQRGLQAEAKEVFSKGLCEVWGPTLCIAILRDKAQSWEVGSSHLFVKHWFIRVRTLGRA